MLEKYIQQFEKDLELEEPLKKSSGSYVIALNEGITILISEIPGGFTLSSNFLEFPKKNVNDIYIQTLTANLFGKGTKGSVIGLNDQGNMLTISQTVDYNVEYKEFKEMIEDFITAIDYWKEQITSLKN